MKRKLIIC